MATSRKRKHVASDAEPTKQPLHGKPQQSIKAFGTVRKATEDDNGLKKRKMVHQREPTPPPSSPVAAKTDKKRKRALETVNEDESEDRESTPPPKDRIFNESSITKDVATPRNKRVKNVHPLSPTETPSKSAIALFGKMKLDTVTKPIPFVFGVTNETAYDTPPASPEAIEDLPKELQELSQLHVAFLSALSLYYAHNGTSSPVNVKALLPMITKSWNKRSVTLDNLRVLLAIASEDEDEFILQDFGRAGICLTKHQPRGRVIKRAASFVDECSLHSQFEKALLQKWTNWATKTPKENLQAGVFLDQLSIPEIQLNESVTKAAPLFARGQQRLSDLKAGQTAAKLEGISPSEITSDQKTKQAVQNRGTSLLDRILAKQALTSSLPAGPTKDQLERKAALQRIEDIARVLDLMTAGRARHTLSMQAMIQQLQQSLRNPISKDEVVRCLNLMAKEITPGYINVIQSGSVMGVVLTKSGKVSLEELRVRVTRAGA